MDASIVICTHNGSEVIEKTILAIANQDLAESSAELIVVDNASTDGTLNRASIAWKQGGAPFELTLLQEPNPGKVHAIKVGLEATKGNVVIFVDDDNRLFPNYVKTAINLFLAMPDLGAAGGKLIATFDDVSVPDWFERWKHLYGVGMMHPDGDSPNQWSLYGAGMCIRRSAWEFLVDHDYQPVIEGRKGEALTSGTDFELCKSIALAGWELYSTSALSAHHHMETKRLSWEYLKRLVTGIASGYPELIVFQRMLAQKMGYPIMAFSFTYAFALLKKRLKMMVFALSKGADIEGNDNYLRFLLAEAEYVALRDGKARYMHLWKQLKTAKWVQ